MADTVNIGTAPDNNTGDPLRTAFKRINDRIELEKSESIGRDVTETAERRLRDSIEAAVRTAADEMEAAARTAADEMEAAARTAAIEMEAAARTARDLEIEGQVASVAASFYVRTWATGQAYSPGVIGSLSNRRDVVLVAGVWYVAAVSHTAGAVFADDLAAGKWLTTDPVQLRGDLASEGTNKGAEMVSGVDIRLTDYTALRSYGGSKVRVYLTGVLATTQPQGIAGVFIHRPADTTSADNGGTIIVDGSGRRWHRQYDGPVSVGWFGALGDGVTDDHAAIQSAIDFASQNYSRRGVITELRLSNGVYAVADYVVVKSGVSLVGNSGSTVIKGAFAAPVNRIITSPSDTLQTDITLKNFTVDRTAINSQHGILLGGISNLMIDGVDVIGFGPGVMSGAMGISPFDEFARIQSLDVTVKNCRIHQGNNFGISFGNVKRGRIINNTFTDCYREAIGLEAWGNGTDIFETHGVVEQCIASGNTIHCSTSASNHFEGFSGPALFVGASSSQGTCKNNIVSDNVIYIDNPAAENNYAGMLIYGGSSNYTEGITVKGNTIVNAPREGIGCGISGYLQRNCHISGNTIVNANASGQTADTHSGILARSISGSVISNNVVIGSNHRYGVLDDSACSNLTFNDNDSTGHAVDSFKRNSTTSVFRDSRTIISSQAAEWINEVVTVADDASVTLSARGTACRCIAIISSQNGGNYAMLVFNGAAAPVVISKSSDVIVGATDQNTDGALNVYPSPTSRIGLTNRMGVSRKISVTTFGIRG